MTKGWLQPAVLACLFAFTAPAVAEPISQSLSSQLSVSGQMTQEKFHKLMKSGFKSVIVNRPDAENGNLVTVNQLRDIAEKQQVSVIYQPVNGNHLSQANIEEFAKYYNELPKPILMVCRSGTRSTVLFNKAKAQGLIYE